MCKGEGCNMKQLCHRYEKGIKDHSKSNYVEYFNESPFKVDKGLFICDFFWGDKAQLLFEQLTRLIDGRHNKSQAN